MFSKLCCLAVVALVSAESHIKAGKVEPRVELLAEPPSVEMNDGNVDFFSPTEVCYRLDGFKNFELCEDS